ncbi:MAG: hypothetical protein ABR600_12620 [Actinomycetota bacterium]
MLRKLTVIAGVALAVAAVAGWALSASAGPSASAGSSAASKTLKFLDHTAKGSYVDLADEGYSPGDEFVFHDVLRRGGKAVGTVDGFCKITAARPVGFSACAGTIKLPGGQIEIQLGGRNIGGGRKPFSLGITGGTGSYESSRGSGLVKPVSEQNSYVTLNLTI